MLAKSFFSNLPFPSIPQYNGTCKATCPRKTYNNNGICQPCNKNCSEPISKTRRYCSGPEALPKQGGCNYCKFIKADKELKTGQCLAVEPPSHYSERIPKNMRYLRNFTDKNSKLVIPCHPACRECISSRDDSCYSCTEGYLKFKERQCYKKCPSRKIKTLILKSQTMHRIHTLNF